MRRLLAMIFIMLCFTLHAPLYAEETQLKLYRPFGQVVEQEPLVIKEIYQGDCRLQSQHIKREDAWRCTANQRILDPCFIRPYGNLMEAVCPESPWNGTSIALKLPYRADNSTHFALDLSRTYPWGVELQKGEKCLAVDEGKTVEGLPIRYLCKNQTVLIGHLQRCKTPWTMLQRNLNGTVETVTILKAWF